jgi:tRNA pseudouridine13 synthase
VEISKIIYFQKIATATKKLQYPSALIEELKTQKQFFKLFLGDIVMNYPYGKIQTVKNMQQSAKKFDSFTPTGLLSGSKAIRASSDAYFLEENYDDIELQSLKGDRRYAWVWPNKIKKKFNAHTQSLTLEFDLLKGTYATTFLEELAQRELY